MPKHLDIRAYDLITRRFRFDAAHRVHGHPGKCQYLHGHGYMAEVSIYASQLNHLGMVFDFGIIKDLIGGWIEERWDHNVLLHSDDVLARMFTSSGGVVWDGLNQVSPSQLFAGKSPFIMPCHAPNPTAENIARVLLETSVEIIQHYCEAAEDQIVIGVSNVRIWETPNCYADYGSLG